MYDYHISASIKTLTPFEKWSTHGSVDQHALVLFALIMHDKFFWSRKHVHMMPRCVFVCDSNDAAVRACSLCVYMRGCVDGL